MLEITIPEVEQFDEEKEEFVTAKAQTIKLEHSLVSLSKWESKWCKPFLSKEEKSMAEMIDYIRCMTITQNVDPSVYDRINMDFDLLYRVRQYIDEPMTATTFSNLQKSQGRRVVTAELIYYWMIALNIPFECQKWHLNRLITLITVCNIENQPKKKMGRNAQLSRNARLNAARRRQLNTKG